MRFPAPAARDLRAGGVLSAPADDLFFSQRYAEGQDVSASVPPSQDSPAIGQSPHGQVQRTPVVQIQQRNMPLNRISTKRQLMHLDFVKMKRQDKDIKGIIATKFPAAEKLLYKKGEEPSDDLYGHYWTEIGNSKGNAFTPEKSFGWWPDDEVSFTDTFKGVPGILNRGDPDHDPHEGDAAPVEFHPAMEVDTEKEDYAAIRSRVTSDIENFARGYKGKWHWRLGWGKNCITFQKSLKTKVGLHFQKGKGWLRAPDSPGSAYDDDGNAAPAKNAYDDDGSASHSYDDDGGATPAKHLYDDDGSTASEHGYDDDGDSTPAKHVYDDDGSAESSEHEYDDEGSASEQHQYNDDAGKAGSSHVYNDGAGGKSPAAPGAPPLPEVMGPKTKYGENLKKDLSYDNENVDSLPLLLDALFKVPFDQLTVKYTKAQRAIILKRNGWSDEDVNGFEQTLTSKVKYLDDDERAAYELSLGSIIRRGLNPKPYDTSESYTNGIGKSHAIFVMDGIGTFFTGDHKIGAFHHSSFLAGGNVAAAGSMKVEGGKLKEISNKSGHYTPNDSHLRMALSELKESGVSISSAKVRSYNPKTSKFDQLDEADAFLQGGAGAKQSADPLSMTT